jgi:hypothetical protein
LVPAEEKEISNGVRITFILELIRSARSICNPLKAKSLKVTSSENSFSKPIFAKRNPIIRKKLDYFLTSVADPDPGTGIRDWVPF